MSSFLLSKSALESGKTKEATEKAVKEAEQKLEEKAPIYEEIEEVEIKKHKLPFRLKLKEMDKMFLKEETGKGWCAPKAVKYLNKYERIEFKLSVKEGKIYDNSGNLFDTTDAGNLFGDGKAIFVMDENGQIFASKYQEFGEFHHSSFLSGNPVASAGELKVTKGVIEEVTRKSGHYRPPEDINKQLIKVLEAKGVDTKNIKLSDGF